MKGRQWWVAGAVLLLAGVMGSAGGAGYWRRYVAALQDAGTQARARLVQPRLKLPGMAAAQPRATPESELIETGVLQQAADTARQQGAQALLVHRHGHRVFEYFAAGRSGETEVEGGELSAALSALALGARVDARSLDAATAVSALRDASRPQENWRNPWSAAAQQRFSLAAPPAVMTQDLDGGGIAVTISNRVWLPLGAADGALWGVDDSRLRLDCCVVARVEDWMRVADLFLQQGSYQGQRIVSADWIRQLLAADARGQRHPVWLDSQQPWTGDEPPATREIYWFDLGSDARLWLAPRRNLAILLWAGRGNARNTLIPNIILRGLQDQLPAGGATGLNDLVPGH